MTPLICGQLCPGMSASVICTYLADHDGECSWAEYQRARFAKNIASSTDAMNLASAILDGDFDPYLELILNAAHNRKRALRSVPGFRKTDSAS